MLNSVLLATADGKVVKYNF